MNDPVRLIATVLGAIIVCFFVLTLLAGVCVMLLSGRISQDQERLLHSHDDDVPQY